MRRTHRLCPNPGDLAARPPPEAGRSCRPLRPPCRPASATRHALPRRVAPHRTRPRSTHPDRSDRPASSGLDPPRPTVPRVELSLPASSTHRRLRRTAPSCRARGRRARQRRSRVPHVHLSPTPATFHTPLVPESRPPRIIRARARDLGCSRPRSPPPAGGRVEIVRVPGAARARRKWTGWRTVPLWAHEVSGCAGPEHGGRAGRGFSPEPCVSRRCSVEGLRKRTGRVAPLEMFLFRKGDIALATFAPGAGVTVVGPPPDEPNIRRPAASRCRHG